MKVYYVIELAGYTTGERSTQDGEFLVSYDPCAFQGMGYIETSPDLEDAKVFDSIEEVRSFYRQSCGTRADGEPNRPLTSLNIIARECTAEEISLRNILH